MRMELTKKGEQFNRSLELRNRVAENESFGGYYNPLLPSTSKAMRWMDVGVGFELFLP